MATKTTTKTVNMTVKKTTRKADVKKTPTKSVAKTANKKKELVVADQNTSFWVTNGQILNSLVALRDALDQMEKEVYLYHAGKVQNDFVNWVSAVLNDSACAKDLGKAKTPKSAKTVIVRHLKTYSV